MKIVSGKLTSTKISLSKAAKVLSNFESAETGASQAVSAYLRRASVSFNELVQFHKDLKASKSDRKLKKHAQESTKSEDPAKHEQKLGEKEVGRNVEDGDGSHSARKKHKKKKKKKKNEDVEREVGDSTVIVKENRKEKKKRKSREVDDEDIVVSAEQNSSKKKRKIEGED